MNEPEVPCTKIVFFGDSITESGRNQIGRAHV